MRAEKYLAGSAVLSVIIALVLSRLPSLAFGGIVRMAIVLVASDVITYAFIKAKVIR
jgi:hypothetical protein